MKDKKKIADAIVSHLVKEKLTYGEAVEVLTKVRELLEDRVLT